MNKVFISLFLCLAMLNSRLAVAQNISDLNSLVDQGKLSVSVKVVQGERQIVGQALIISIEVATDRWFATGSRVQNFTLNNVVMQANNITTINGSKRLKGQTWAMQTHEITLYPTLAGHYKTPEINVDVSVNTENNGIVSGVLTTKKLDFSIALPEELNGIDNFIVSPDVAINIEGEFQKEKDYAVGEAITQTITITASDTPAMMIPEINLFAASDTSEVANNKDTKKAALDGISIYHKPAQVFDKSNRGTLSGTRIESFTYIFEKAGSYELPEQIIYWWNSQSNTLEELVIPASSWTVSGSTLANIKQSTNSLQELKFNLVTIVTLAMALFLLILTYFIVIKRQLIITSYNKLTKKEQRQLRKHFLTCIAQEKYLEASQYLYQYSVLLNKQEQLMSLPLAKELNQLAFQLRPTEKARLIFSHNDATALIEQITTATSVKGSHANFSSDEPIKLNNLNAG